MARRFPCAPGKGNPKGGRKAPDPGHRLPKFLLSPYVDEVGSPFYCRGKEEDQVLKPQSIAGNATAQNTEWACRPGIALSEACGVAEMGHNVLQELFTSKSDLAKSVAAMGLKDLERALESSEGKSYMAACAHLNKVNNAEVTDASVKSAIQDWLHWLQDGSDKKARAFRKLARVAGRLYLWSMDSLEQLAFATEPKAYAKAMKATMPADAPAALTLWAGSPQDAKKLVKALQATYRGQVQARKKKARKGLAQESGSSPTATASGSKSSTSSDKKSSPSSSEPSKKKDKKKKQKLSKKEKDKKEKDKKEKDKKEPKAPKADEKEKKEKKRKEEKDNSEEKEKKRAKPSPQSASSLRDFSSEPGTVPETAGAAALRDLTEDQNLAFMEWQLSEVQSSTEDWVAFNEALRGGTASAEEFTKHLDLIPPAVRKAFKVKVSKIPKADTMGPFLERITAIHEAAMSFWEAQNAGK